MRGSAPGWPLNITALGARTAIAKIESGQSTLNMAGYAIESVVETLRSATESLTQNKKLSLKTEVAKMNLTTKPAARG